MKNKYPGIIAVLIIITLFSSCKKNLLDKYPKDAPNAANFFANSDNAREAALGGWSALKEENWFYKRYFIKICNYLGSGYWGA